jgi:hypothetical protein
MRLETVLALGLLMVTGCDRAKSASSVFGSANVHISETMCAGKIALSQGSASVRDACFSGDTNIVLCTNESHPAPVRCKATAGVLTIEGTSGDVIDYARIR